jgi:serine/threonine protein kinase
MASHNVEFDIATGFQEMEALLLNMKQKFSSIEGGYIHDQRNQLKVIDYAGKKLVVKSFKIPNKLNQFVYKWFRDSKAKRSYQYSLQLRAIGISTPKPVGYVEYYDGNKLQESYYISEYFEHEFEVREVTDDETFCDRAIILKKVAEFAYRMHSLGAIHLDFSPGNILVQKNDDDYRLAICDVNRMKFEAISHQQGLANFVRLIRDEQTLDILARTYAELDGRDSDTSIKQLSTIRKSYLKKRLKIRRIKALFKSR